MIWIESDIWWANSSGLDFFSPREQTRQDGADDWGRGERTLSQVQRAVPAAAHPARAGGSLENMRWVEKWDLQVSSKLRNVMAVYDIEHMCEYRENGISPLLIHLMFIIWLGLTIYQCSHHSNHNKVVKVRFVLINPSQVISMASIPTFWGCSSTEVFPPRPIISSSGITWTEVTFIVYRQK